MDAIKQAYDDWIAARGRARKIAREEYKAQIDARISGLSAFEQSILVHEIQRAIETGTDASEIRIQVFGSNPLLWPEIRTAAGIEMKKRGRPAGEIQHGKNGTYTRGCRCEECTTAAREYQRDYNARKRASK